MDIISSPQPTSNKGQRSASVSDVYFTRVIPSWSQPSILSPQQWRVWVNSQPVAVTCKETMTSNILDLDWKITPRKSDDRDELKGVIAHYEKLFRHGGYSVGMDWSGFIEWSLQDLLDLPFGTAWEVGRKGDDPKGRVVWLEPIDGGTLYPTNNKQYPVIQYYNGFMAQFPSHAIARAYLNPRTDIERKGWGVAPPEKIFMAMEMLARGDRYYANLLLDIPPVGVFDLGDITWEDAHVWIKSFREFAAGGLDSFKIPVLAEHTGNNVKFIPLGKDPNAIMYDTITLKYAALTVAGYGMSLGDIGLQGSSKSGETLAGSIRSEQKTNRTGKARAKAKLKYMIESILPPELQFDFIDTDGERLSMLGRARLANATAMNQFREMESISPEEARLQMIQDGLFTISMPEKPPAEAKKETPKLAPNKKAAPERPGQVGAPQAPSLGGDGEVKRVAGLVVEKGKSFDARLNKLVKRIYENISPILEASRSGVSDDELHVLRSVVNDSLFGSDDTFGLGKIVNSIKINEDWISVTDTDLALELKSMFSEKYRWDFTDEQIDAIDFSQYVEQLKHGCFLGMRDFIGKSIVAMLSNHILNENEFDNGNPESYDIVEVMRSTVSSNFADFASAYIGVEVEKILDDIRNKESK